jgi:hypothetical protein
MMARQHHPRTILGIQLKKEENSSIKISRGSVG